MHSDTDSDDVAERNYYVVQVFPQNRPQNIVIINIIIVDIAGWPKVKLKDIRNIEDS